jgi:hypothetical protein
MPDQTAGQRRGATPRCFERSAPSPAHFIEGLMHVEPGPDIVRFIGDTRHR